MLLNATYPEKFRKDMERRCTARRIELVFSELTDYIPEYGTVGLTTRSGMSIPTADLIVPTFGPRPNTAWIASLGPDVLDARRLVKVKPTFEVVGHPGVFAVGDITDWNEQKQGMKYPLHAEICAPNVHNFLERRPQTRTYRGTTEIILIPLGRVSGLYHIGAYRLTVFALRRDEVPLTSTTFGVSPSVIGSFGGSRRKTYLSTRQGKIEGCHPPTGNCALPVYSDYARDRRSLLVYHYFILSLPLRDLFCRTFALSRTNRIPLRPLSTLASPGYGRKGFVALLYPNHSFVCILTFVSPRNMCHTMRHVTLSLIDATLPWICLRSRSGAAAF